jgi:cytochrome c biogenesis protein CcmG, thiol:disulfide interchange protein DsbE
MQSLSWRAGGRAAVLALALLLTLLAGSPALFSGPALADKGESAGKAESTTESTAPDFSMKGVDGKVYSLKSLLEKGPVLLDFWTTWCKPCMQELPELQRIYDAHKKQGFTLLGVPSDDSRSSAKVKPMIRSKRMTFPNIPDPNREVGNLYNVRNYPTTVLIAQDGRIVHYAQGYLPGDEKELEEKIKALLAESGGED